MAFTRLLAVLLIASSCTPSPGRAQAATDPQDLLARRLVMVEVADIGPDGVGFGLHPTTDQVKVSTTAVMGTVSVCPADSAGGTQVSKEAWPGECVGLDPEHPLRLHPTSGGEHVGLRITVKHVNDGDQGTVSVTWTGADSFFGYQPGVLDAATSSSIIFSFTAAGELAGYVRSDGDWKLSLDGKDSDECYEGSNDAENVTLTTVTSPGEMTMTYINQSTHAQTPQLSIEWPAPSIAGAQDP